MAFLRYDIAVVGQDQVRAALRSIESEALASNRRTVARMATGGRRRGAVVPASDRAQLTQSVKVTDRAEQQKTAIELREERKREAASVALQRQRSAALLSQYRADQRAHEKTERDKTRAEQREAKKREALDERARKQSERDSRKQQRLHLVEDKRNRTEYRRNVTGVLGGTASRLSSVGRAGVAMAGLAGGAIFATAGHSALAGQARAAELANQLLGNGADQKALTSKRDEITAAVKGTRGFATEDVIEGMSRFQGVAGEGEATMKMAPILTKTSLATGADMGELGDMYASMYAAIRNSTGGAKKSVDEIIAEVEKLGRVFGAMGQVGAIEIKDVAAVGSEITAAAMSYEGNIADNIQKVGAMMQIAKQTGGAGGMGGAEASTAVQNFANDLVQKKDDVQKYLKANGGSDASMFSDKSRTKLKSLDVLLPELMAATGGDLVKMGDILNIRGTRGLKGFTEPYQEKYKEAKAAGKSDKEAREVGKQAVRDRFAQFAGIEMSKGEVEAKASFRLSQGDKLLEENFRRLTQAVGAELLPVIIDLTPKIAYLVPLFVDAASALGTFIKVVKDNPLSSLGAIIGAAFVLELGKAKIAQSITRAIERTAPVGGAGGAGGTPGSPGAPGMPGAPGKLGVGAVVPALAAGVAAFTITTATLNVLGTLNENAGERASKTTGNEWQEYNAKRAEILSSAAPESEKQERLFDLAQKARQNAEYTKESSSILPGFAQNMVDMLPEWHPAKIAFGSKTGEQVREGVVDSKTGERLTGGIEGWQKQLAQDQSNAAKALQAAAAALEKAAPRISVNTSNQPSPVKT